MADIPNPFKPVAASAGGQATISASAGALIPGAYSGPSAGNVLRVANKGIYAMRLKLGADNTVAATSNDLLIGPGDTELITVDGSKPYYSVLGVAGAAVTGVTNGTTDYSITLGINGV